MTSEQLAHIHKLCFTMPRPWSRAEFDSLRASPRVFLLQSSNGFALGRQAGPELELLTIAVIPDAQGKGEGRQLLGSFIESARQKFVQEIFLEVAETNPTAIGLYESVGFARTGRREGYYQVKNAPNIAAIVMKMVISDKA